VVTHRLVFASARTHGRTERVGNMLAAVWCLGESDPLQGFTHLTVVNVEFVLVLVLSFVKTIKVAMMFVPRVDFRSFAKPATY
jgi:hypothetical protein